MSLYSHIVMHLRRSGVTKAVRLHAGSEQADTVVECYNCGCRNLFQLGFLRKGADQNEALFLCRPPCPEYPTWKPDASWFVSLSFLFSFLFLQVTILKVSPRGRSKSIFEKSHF